MPFAASADDPKSGHIYKKTVNCLFAASAENNVKKCKESEL